MARRKDVSKSQIMDAAQALLSAHGFNGFSTRELADELGISSASLHHHFTTKGDLAAAVIARYREQLNERFAMIAAEVEGFALRTRSFSDAMTSDATLLAMVSANFPTLPLIAQSEARQLYSNVLGWLTRFAVQAKADGELHADDMPENAAASVLAGTLGRAMLARMDSPASVSMPAMTWAWQR
jgi:TetR/AcrR family transcriptional repressor of nem operon